MPSQVRRRQYLFDLLLHCWQRGTKIFHTKFRGRSCGSMSSDGTFPFMRLPDELQVYFLRTILQWPEPITNPYIRNGDIIRGLPVEILDRHDFSAELNVQILATCRKFNIEGTRILYGCNVFRFTHFVKVQQALNGARFQCVPQCQLVEFLSKVHISHEQDDTESSKRQLPRSSLIKNVILHSYDDESDVLASRGVARAPPRGLGKREEMAIMEASWQFIAFCILDIMGCQLECLTMTFDAQTPSLSTLLEYDGELWSNRSHFSSSPTRSREQRWHELKVRTARLPSHRIEETMYMASHNMMTVNRLIIRGTEKEEEPHPFANEFDPRDTNQIKNRHISVYRTIRQWLAIAKERRHVCVNRIECSGEFHIRRLRRCCGEFIADKEWKRAGRFGFKRAHTTDRTCGCLWSER